jgi:hypothetical protein
MEKINYAFYPTLLDSFSYYLQSDKREAFGELIDKINRVEKPKGFPQKRGIFFNDWVDGKVVPTREELAYYKLEHSTSIVSLMNELLRGSIRQVYVETIISSIAFGNIRLYGFVDAIYGDTAYDIKTTGIYNGPHYYNGYQHLVYLECLKHRGINRFEYLITDFEEIYRERVVHTQEGYDKLFEILMQFIYFIQKNRDLITDPRIFGDHYFIG